MDNMPYAKMARKFGLDEHELSTLHHQYNTVPIALQDEQAFQHDVVEMSKEAKNLDQFKEMLWQRRELRHKELTDAFEYTAQYLVACPRYPSDEVAHWISTVQFFRSKSLDALLEYFGSFLPPDLQHPTFPQPKRSSKRSRTPEPSTPRQGVNITSILQHDAATKLQPHPSPPLSDNSSSQGRDDGWRSSKAKRSAMYHLEQLEAKARKSDTNKTSDVHGHGLRRGNRDRKQVLTCSSKIEKRTPQKPRTTGVASVRRTRRRKS